MPHPHEAHSGAVSEVPTGEGNDLSSFADQFNDPEPESTTSPQQESAPQPSSANKAEAPKPDTETTENPNSQTAADDATDTNKDDTTEPSDTKTPRPKAKAKKSSVEKRLDGQFRLISDLKSQIAEMGKINKTLAAKLDGTYEEPEPKPEAEIRNETELQTKVKVSRAAASRKYSKELVDEQIFDKDSPYNALAAEHPWIENRVLASDDPVEEAFLVLRQYEFFDEFDSTDPVVIQKQLHTQIREEVLNELKKEGEHVPTGNKPPSTRYLRTIQSKTPANKGAEEFNPSEINPGLSEVADS